MVRKAGLLWALLGGFLISPAAQAQYQWGVNEVSLSLSNAQWGLPFLQFTPLHPGIEASMSFLSIDKENFRHDVAVYGGFFYHELMATAPYLDLSTTFQYKVGRWIGTDFRAGAGYLHGFYPGEAYVFSANTGQFETVQANQSFFLATAGMGISALGLEGIEPFVRMDMMMLNNVYNMVTLVKVGLEITLQ